MVRRKNRYCLVEIKFEDPPEAKRNISSQDVYLSVKQAILECYGDYGFGVVKDSLMVKYLNPDTNMVIIRATRDHHCQAHVAFTYVKKIKGYSCFLNTLYIGGTIRSCQKFLVLHHRHHLLCC